MIATFIRLWIMIKRPPFIYVVFNFIIVYILLSSTVSLHLRFYRKPKSSSLSNSQHETTMESVDVDETASSGVVEVDRDTWWCQIVDGEDDDNGDERGTTSLEGQRGGEKIVDNGDETKTTSFEVELPKTESEEVETASFQEVKEGVDGGGECEVEDTLDATWEAIMEAKRKGSGPQLTKSDTWSAGNKKGRLGREKIAAELKKWQTFNKVVGEKENRVGGSSGGGGWRRMEVMVSDHDELKKRADAFISRFTHDIRLQRLESDQRFLEIMNRGL